MDYLASMFPTLTQESQDDLKNYFTNISQDIFSKIDDFLKYEIIDLEETARFSVRTNFVSGISFII